MDISLLLPCHTGISTPIGNSHRNDVHPVQTHLSKIPILSLPIRTHFLYKIKHIISKVLSVLISINVQAKLDINLGGQGMVITNQGVAIHPCFHASKTYAIYKAGHWVVFIKTRTETCIKGWDWTCHLRSLRGGPVLRVRSRGTGPRSLARSTARRRFLPHSHRDLRCIQTNTQSRKRNKSFIVELESETIKIWR